MKTALTYTLTATIAIASLTWLAGAQEAAQPGEVSWQEDRLTHPAEEPGPAVIHASEGDLLVQAGVPTPPTITTVPAPAPTADASPGPQKWEMPIPAGVTIHAAPPMPQPMREGPHLFRYAASPEGVDVFVPGPQRKQLDEETAKQLNADRELSAKLMGAVERYKNSDEGQKADASNAIREVVSKQFDVRQRLRERELAELEERLGKLRELHAKRQQQKDQIINDRFQQVLRDADGLGWGDATPDGDMFYFRTGGADAAPAQDMLFKVQAAQADAAHHQGELGISQPVIAGANVVVDPQSKGNVLIVPGELAKKADAVANEVWNKARTRVQAASNDGYEKARVAKDLAARAKEVGNSEAARKAADEAKRASDEAWRESQATLDEVRREMEQARLEVMKGVMEAQEEAKRAAEEAHEEAARQDRESKDESWEEHP